MPRVALSEIKVDRRIKALIPRASDEDRASIKSGLARDGQKVPMLILPDNRLLDGHTRLELLRELGVEKAMVQKVSGLKTEEDVHFSAIAVNLERRHLDDIQRGELGLALEKVERKAARLRKREGAKKGGKTGGKKRPAKKKEEKRAEPKRTRDEVGKRVGLSGRKYDRVTTVLKEGTKDQVEAVRSGKKSVNQVCNEIARKKRKEETKEKAKKLKPKDLKGEVVHGDAYLVMGSYHGKVDLVVVDPPYGIADSSKSSKKDGVIVGADQALPRWDRTNGKTVVRKCLGLSHDLLREGGSVFMFLDKLLVTDAWEEAIRARLVPRNTFYWVKSNPVPSARGNFSSGIEVVLYATRGGGQTWNLSGDAPNWIQLPIVGGKERTDHPSQKPVKLYKHFLFAASNQGDLVCDFMAGSGTMAEAATDLRRRWVVCEKEEAYVDLIKARISG